MSNLFEEIELSKLSSLPHVLIKLLHVCHEDNVCFDTLTDIITVDAVLSAKVLSVANSPVHAGAYKLTSLKQVLLYLGLDTIKSIVITASVQQFFSRYSREKSRFLKNFWQHTLFTAIVAKSLAKLTSYNNPDEAYVTGLLHDIGQLILENYSKEEYSRLLQTSLSSDALLAAEYEKYNTTHTDLAVRLLELWGVPQVMSQAVKYHHASAADLLEAHPLIKIINLSNSMTNKMNADDESVFESGQRIFDLSDSVMSDILTRAKAEVNKVAASLDIDIELSEAAENSDEEKQIQLAKGIRDIALAQASVQPLVETMSGVDYSGMHKSNKILFGIDNSCLFLYEQSAATLRTVYSSLQINQELLDEIEIKPDSHSIIAAAYSSGEIKDTFSAELEFVLPVVDKQIISAFSNDGILCLPLIKTGKPIGVVVLGVNSVQYQQLIDKSVLLKMYASKLADKVFDSISRQAFKENVITDSQQQMHSKAREIIHEVNNPLAVIKNYLHILGKRFNQDDLVQKDIAVISEEIDRVGTIILKCDNDIDEIAASIQSQSVDVNDLIISMNNIMEASLYTTSNVTSQLELDRTIGPIQVNKNSLKQILTNLIKNSVEAMTDNKEIKITTRTVNINGKDSIEIEIADTGGGIPDIVLKNLYKPVKSKKGGMHSGLGLSIVKSIVDEMGGAITCKSSESGTVFYIHLALDITGDRA